MTKEQRKKQENEFKRRSYKRGVVGALNRVLGNYVMGTEIGNTLTELANAAKKDGGLLQRLSKKHGPIS